MATKTPARMVAAALLALTATATTCRAESVPLPTPRPKAAIATANAPATTGSVPLVGQPRPPGIVTTAQNVPAAAANAAVRGGEATAFDATQRALIDKVSAYLSSLQTLVGRFVQVGPDGKRNEGEFYLQKPGKVRFEYDPPSPIELISDGSSVVVRDRKLATQDLYPLSQTPLRFLLSDQINLLRDTNITAVYADDVFVTVVIEEKQPLLGTNRLMLMFGAKDMQLRQWTITDPQGYDTTVAVYDLDPTKRPDPSLFKIDYTQYRN